MKRNPPSKYAAIAASLDENEETLEEIAWNRNQAQMFLDSYQDRECHREARRIYNGLLQRHETPANWWREQDQGSYFNQKIHEALCDIWEIEQMEDSLSSMVMEQVL